jgi:hypothetical protein
MSSGVRRRPTFFADFGFPSGSPLIQRANVRGLTIVISPLIAVPSFRPVTRRCRSSGDG